MKQNKFRWKRVLPDRELSLSLSPGCAALSPSLLQVSWLELTSPRLLRVGGAGAREQRVSLDFTLGPVGCVLRVTGTIVGSRLDWDWIFLCWLVGV